MASPTELAQSNHHPKPIAHLLNSGTANLISLFSAPKRRRLLQPLSPQSASRSSSPIRRNHSPSSQPARVQTRRHEDRGVVPVRVEVLIVPRDGQDCRAMIKGSAPAFVGQVFSMCDLSGSGLMAVSTHFDIPFISKRTPEWLKNMFASVSNSERNGPVFRFFMDLGDAVTYVKRLNIPSGVVGACCLDLAYEHFKEKPHKFQFVPNEKHVKAANKILKTSAQNGKCKRVDGILVFSAQNLDIAIASPDGVKWYTPYFFDKNMLDNILEESVDQHFHSLIHTRHMQRPRDVVDDNLAAEVIEEMGEAYGNLQRFRK